MRGTISLSDFAFGFDILVNMSETDLQLLTRYANQRAEDAFAEIVRRHLDLVHSAALRQVRSPELAEEVAQAVFIELARQARHLPPRTVLAAWLYHVTRRRAIDVVRREAARRLREQTAQELQAMNATAEDWTHIEPLLDDAMDALEETDRLAVLLRYFQNKPLHEVGQAIGVTDDAAQKRVSRAVERLREFFTKRGVTVGANCLALTISANAVQAAPVGLAIPLASAAKAATAANTGTNAIFSAAKWFALTKAKASIAAAVGALLFIGVAAVYESKTTSKPIGQSRLPVGSGVPVIRMGGAHGIILASDRSLWSWGENYAGWPVLGLGNINTQTTLRRIGTDNDWIDVASSFTHCMAIKSDGTMWGWGENLEGQLGLGTSGRRNASRNKPVPTAPGNDWKQVAAGGSHSLAIKTDGSLWAWGLNWAGQLGIGITNKQVTEVTRVGNATNWIKVWAGGVQSVAQQSDGSLWFWGSLTGSDKDTNRYLMPTRISADTNWVDVSFGYFSVFAIKSDGTIWAWGRNAGIYTAAPIQLLNATPARVGTNSDWKTCSSSEYFYHVLQKKDGSLWALDASDYAFVNKTNFRPVEIKPIHLKKDVVAFGATGRSIMGVALTREGEVWTWGKVLGEYTSGNATLQSAADAIKWKTDRFQPKPIMRSEPWLLPIQE